MKRRTKRLYVDEKIARELKAEASAAGMTLQQYLNYKLSKDVKEVRRFRGVF